MNARTLVSAALALMLIGLFAGSNALANSSPEPEPQVQSQSQDPPPNVQDTPGQATFKCPRCGAECPRPHGWAGRGTWGQKGRRGHGREFAGRGSRHGFGERGRSGRGDGVPADRMLRHDSALDLSDDQVTQLEKLAYDAKSKLIDLQSDLEKAQLEMRRQMETDGDNLSAMKGHLESMSKIRVSIQELKLKNWIDAKSVLTDEQKLNIKDRHPRFGSRL